MFKRLLFLVLILFSGAFMAGCAAAGQSSTLLTPPAGLELVAEVDLSQRPREDETLWQFTLPETATATVFFTAEDVDARFFDLSLIEEDDKRLVILHSEAWRTGQHGGGLWEQTLPPGVYQLALSASKDPGKLSVYAGWQ